MDIVSREQVRQYRLFTHHLDRWYEKSDAADIAGACGLRNSPPGAWKSALHSRIPNFGAEEMDHLLENDKTLLQAWSYRGAPVVFPTAQSDVFLSALLPQQNEPWIYTRGIQLALDFLQMPFDELLQLLKQVMPKLDSEVVHSKTALDSVLSQWVAPLLPADKRVLWNQPSMYGAPQKQTVGGAVVSFLLRPCSFLGLVVFGKREGVHPTFTSYKNWTGHALKVSDTPEQKLVRKFLHCFGPSSVGGFANWLGCSPTQAGRMWQTIAGEMEAVSLDGKEGFLLRDDRKALLSPPKPARKLHLLSGHDPYLGLQDRHVILPDKAAQKQVWQTVSNPGALLWEGEIAGIWREKKKGRDMEITVTLWDNTKLPKAEVQDLCHSRARFAGRALHKLTFSP